MKNKSTLLLIVLIFILGGCTKNFDTANENPNEPTNVPTTNLLLSGISSGIFGVVKDRYGTFQSTQNTIGDCGHWVQYFADIQSIGADRYIVDPTGFIYVWGTYYSALKDVQSIIDNPENGQNMIAAAMVIRAFLYNQLTDLFGDIPYFQALKVNDFVQPVYDTQESIYKDLNIQLKLAASKFDPNKDALGIGDILYNGNVNLWKKFANTLRARLINHYKHLDPQAEQELIQLLMNPIDFPVFEINTDNAQLIPTNVYPYRNTMLTVTSNGTLTGNDGISATLVNMLKQLNDPRLYIYAQLNNKGEYSGKPNGSDPANTLSDYSNIGKIYREDPYFPASAMTYAELLFIKAEVLHDKKAYIDGIISAFATYHIAPDSIYLAVANIEFDNNELETIISQKWLALFGKNSIEAFTEYRRTGFPSSVKEAEHSNFPGLGIPHRFNYSNNEESTNGKNLQIARMRQHINPAEYLYGDKMWWAK